MAFLFLILISALWINFSKASEFLINDLSRDADDQQTWAVLPYAFNSESMGFTAGAFGVFSGYIQPQMTIFASAYRGEELDVQHSDFIAPTTESASGAIFAISSYRPSYSERLFLSGIVTYGFYPNQRLYLDGGNDSIKQSNTQHPTSLETQGYNNWAEADARYILPWGESRKEVIPTIELQKGIAVNRNNIGGGKPFVTGQTLVGSELFYNTWTADKFNHSPELNSNGVRFYLEHDNTDYSSNPSRGYSFNGKVSIDFGLGNSTQSWNALEVEYSHFIELDNFSWSRQNTLALNFWSAYSPSWDNSEKINGGVLDKNQPPMWEGARLGGHTRMRAYDANRFNDKAAIYGAIEYRLMPTFNPLENIDWLPIDSLQVVLFAEAGRVAEEYDLSLLLSDMKYDVGFSVRALAAQTPIRFEVAYGEEGGAMWLMLEQPF